MKTKAYSIFIAMLLVLLSCSPQKRVNNVIVGIPSDLETMNPLYAFSVEEGNIAELLYLSLVESSWDSEMGNIKYSPMLAKNWEWITHENAILINLRDDVLWSDGQKCTLDDVIFSFDIYSDPVVMSRVYGYFENFHTIESGKIDIEKTFEKVDQNSLKIKFKDGTYPKMIDIDFPILPKHFYEKYNRAELPNLSIDKFVTNGAFFLEEWNKEASIILRKNTN